MNDPTDTNGALVPVARPAPPSPAAPSLAQVMTAGPNHYTSLKPITPESKLQLYQALNGTTEQMGRWLNRKMVVTDLVCQEAEFHNEESGEVWQGVRTVLILESGELVGTCSNGVLRSLQTAALAFGPAPWKPGLVFTPVEKEVKNQRRMYLLECDGPKAADDGQPSQAKPSRSKG